MNTNEIVLDTVATWAASAAANTAVNIDIPGVATYGYSEDVRYAVMVTNPSTVTAVAVAVKAKDTINGATSYPTLQSFTVPVNTPEGTVTIVEGLLIGEGARLTLTNPTALGVGQGFSAGVKIRKI